MTSTSYGSISNNLLPQSATKRAGDNSVSASTSMSYDAIGNVTSMTDPVNATTQMTYNADRQVTETISADPDGSGPLKARAVRTNYNTDGTISSVETGTDTGNNFVSLQQLASGYDSYGRKTSDTLTAGGTTYGVTQYAFDVNGRPSCTAVRMNPSSWTSQSDACTQTSNGADGPDRITKIGYDAVGRPKTQTSAVGTSTPITETTLYYGPSGELWGAGDARSNLTTYSYDPYDRYYAATYQDNSYELLTLDANGNTLTKRLRDGNTLSYSYDNLNRVTQLTTAHLTTDDQNTQYTYDLVGHLTLAAKNASNQTALSWDALGRRTGESNYYYALTFGYDAAGRRTRETWSDGFYVTYDYDALGEMTGVRENGGFTLASFGYDDLGRRTSLTRGNGANTSYGYDGASRLGSLTQDLSGSAWDLSLTFGYNAASQIRTRTSSNTAYAWGGAMNVDRSYAVNNLNQYSSATSYGVTINFGYDQRGNLTASGSTGYGYTSKNRLAVTPNGGYLYADSLERNDTISPEGVQLAHDGPMIASETSTSSPTGPIRRRYVYGPGDDEALVWYEGSGTNDRRWLHADERGSIVAVSDGSGSKLAVNTYDEFGIPGAGNIGRFQYTGQAYYPSIGLYDYKARMYSPTLGRFLQTDPIGYADGINWYNYAHADPVNNIDPSGLACSANQVRIDTGTGYTYMDHGDIVVNRVQICLSKGSSATGNISYGGGPVKKQTSVPQKVCGNGVSFASGGYLGASAEAGIGAVGAGAQGSYSAMSFTNGEGAVLKTTGAFAGGPGYGVSSPSSRSSFSNSAGGVVIGGTIGAGGGLAFSNARKANDLIGNAQTYNVNIGPISVSASFGDGGIFSVNAGLSLGASFAVSTYQTTTTVVYRDTKGCK